jgi:hypothetical protein
MWTCFEEATAGKFDFATSFEMRRVTYSIWTQSVGRPPWKLGSRLGSPKADSPAVSKPKQDHRRLHLEHALRQI